MKDKKLTRKKMKGDGEEVMPSVSVRCAFSLVSAHDLGKQTLGDSPLLSYSCLGLREGLHQFWTWLELVANESGRSILIAAHNGSGFDFPILLVLLPLAYRCCGC